MQHVGLLHRGKIHRLRIVDRGRLGGNILSLDHQLGLRDDGQASDRGSSQTWEVGPQFEHEFSHFAAARLTSVWENNDWYKEAAR